MSLLALTSALEADILGAREIFHERPWRHWLLFVRQRMSVHTDAVDGDEKGMRHYLRS